MKLEARLGHLALKIKVSTPFLLTLLLAGAYFVFLPFPRQQEVVEVWQDFRDDYIYGLAYDVHRKAGTAATGIFGLASIRYFYEVTKRFFQAAQ